MTETGQPNGLIRIRIDLDINAQIAVMIGETLATIGVTTVETIETAEPIHATQTAVTTLTAVIVEDAIILVVVTNTGPTSKDDNDRKAASPQVRGNLTTDQVKMPKTLRLALPNLKTGIIHHLSKTTSNNKLMLSPAT